MKSIQKADNSIIRRMAEQENIPVMDYILKKIRKLGEPVTIFAVCPNSEAVLKASIRAAKHADAPIKYAATLNQVDVDGGYTGWTPEIFVGEIRKACVQYGFEGPVIAAVDHGGPWLKDIQALRGFTLDKAMDEVKHSFESALLAGYDLLHVDPTVDKTIKAGETISIDTVASRTLDIIRFTEAFRSRRHLPPVSYEVGTEEVHGGLADMDVFRRFLILLKQGLKQNGLQSVWPCFVVGKVGTDLHTTFFDPRAAAELAQEAALFGSVIKGHYTDSVENPQDYPRAGMGGANVGPEFTEAEYMALMELANTEERLFLERQVNQPSDFSRVLKEAVVQSGRWKKWLLADEQAKDFSQITTERQGWLVRTGCRYIWAQDTVKAARARLYQNLENNGIEAEELVLAAIEKVMAKYFTAFNLTGLNRRILDT